MSLKKYIFKSGVHFVHLNITVCTICKRGGGHYENHSCYVILISTSGSGDLVCSSSSCHYV